MFKKKKMIISFNCFKNLVCLKLKLWQEYHLHSHAYQSVHRNYICDEVLNDLIDLDSHNLDPHMLQRNKSDKLLDDFHVCFEYDLLILIYLNLHWGKKDI